MKILLLCESAQMSLRVRNEMTSLQKAGHEISVVYAVRRGQVAKGRQLTGARNEIYLPLAGPNASPRLALAMIGFYRRVSRTLDAETFDVVHCTHLFLLPIALILAKRTGAKVVYDAYEMHAVDWARYVPLLRERTRPAFEALENRLVSRVACVLTVDSQDDVLEERYSRVNSNVVVLLNVPVLIESLERSSIELGGDRRLAHVGKLYDEKGLNVCLDAFSLVIRRFPRTRLLLLGGLDESVQDIDTRLKARGLAGHVEIVEWMPYNEMLAVLAGCDVGLALAQPTGRFLHISRGNSRKIFSYMQAGIPILAPSFGEAGLVVSEEKCGLLVDTTDPLTIATAVTTLLSDREQAKSMGARGRRAIREKYNWAIEEQKLLRAYEKLV